MIIFIFCLPLYNLDNIKLLNSRNFSYADDNRVYFIKTKVEKVTDGDTISAKVYDETYIIRLIGVDTPETFHPRKPVEFFGKEASDFTKESLKDKTIFIEKDVSEVDKYGRLLRYVWIKLPKDPLNPTYEEIRDNMFNGILLRDGYASTSTFPPDVKYSEIFSKIAKDARDKKKGLWDNEKRKNFKSPKATKNANISEEKGLENYKREQKTKRIYNNNKKYLADTTVGPIKGNKNSKVYHSPGQRDYNKISINNVIRFNNKKEAEDNGYRPSQR